VIPAPGTERNRLVATTAGLFLGGLAYVLTRPLGASFADWMSMPRERGGLDWGDGRVSIVLFVVIAAFVAYLATTRRDVQPTADRADAADSAAFVPT